MISDVRVYHRLEVLELAVVQQTQNINLKEQEIRKLGSSFHFSKLFYQNFKDQSGMGRCVSFWIWEHDEKRIQHVLEELDQLLPSQTHDQVERVGNPFRMRLPLEQRQQISWTHFNHQLFHFLSIRIQLGILPFWVNLVEQR